MRLLYLIILLILTLNVCSQKPKKVLGWMNTVHSSNKNFYFEIPFDYRNNEIVIKVTIGNQIYDYIFDTGGYNDITDEIQKKNNYPVLSTQSVGSSNGIKSKMNLVKVDSLKIGELFFKDVAALQLNFDNSPTIKCTIDGALIGASTIKNYIWQIDYSKKKIIVSDQLTKFSLTNKSVRIPVTFNSRLMPFIEAKLDGKKEKFLFDLGSSTLFSLTEKTADKYILSKYFTEVSGSSSEGGNGVSIQTAKLFKADSLEISSIKYKSKPVLSSRSGVENIIGNPVIKNFIVTLNFRENEMYLSPLPGMELKDGWNSFGFRAEFKNNKVRVVTLFKGLYADNAGLKIGDEIISINRQRLDCKNYCDCLLTLTKIFEENHKMVLTIQNGDSAKNISVIKEQVY